MKKIFFCIISILLLSNMVSGVGSARDHIIANTTTGPTPLIVELESNIRDLGNKYTWVLSNGKTIYSTHTTQIFSLPGEYTIALYITYPDNTTSSWSITVNAIDEPNCTPDYDEDGLNNCEDLCPLISWDTLNAWCPLLEQRCDNSCGCDDGYICDNTDQNTCGTTWVCIPQKPQESCYYQAQKNYIFWNAVCNSCPCKSVLTYNADIRKCDILFPAITSPDGKDIYERGEFFEIQ